LLRDLLHYTVCARFVTRFATQPFGGRICYAIWCNCCGVLGNLWGFMQKMSFAALRGIFSQNVCKFVQLLRNLFKVRHTIHYEMVSLIHGGEFVTFWGDFEKTFWDF
jgi:hypothetical protein